MPSKNKPNGYWTFRVHHSERGASDGEIGAMWHQLSEDEKVEWKDYAKNGGSAPQGYNSVRIPEPMPKKKKTSKEAKPDTSSSVDPDSMIYNPLLSREVQAMIDERNAKLAEKHADVIRFTATLPGNFVADEAKSKTIVYLHMFPLYDGDEKSYNLAEWFPSIIYAARLNLEDGAQNACHYYTQAKDVKYHVERCQMLNEGRCQTLCGGDRMATGPRLPIKGACSSSIEGKQFPGWERNYSVVLKNLDDLMYGPGSENNMFKDTIFAHAIRTQNPDLEENWMLHCLEHELMLKRLIKEAEEQQQLSDDDDQHQHRLPTEVLERLKRIRIQPLGYYWATMYAIKEVDDLTKDKERYDEFVKIIKETKHIVGRRFASLVVRPYMKCEYHATEDNKVCCCSICGGLQRGKNFIYPQICMPAEARSIMIVMFSHLLQHYNLGDGTKWHTFMHVEEELRRSGASSSSAANGGGGRRPAAAAAAANGNNVPDMAVAGQLPSHLRTTVQVTSNNDDKW